MRLFILLVTEISGKWSTAGKQLTLGKMTGVFLMLLVGILVGFLGLMVEYVVAAHRDKLHDKRGGVRTGVIHLPRYNQ